MLHLCSTVAGALPYISQAVFYVQVLSFSSILSTRVLYHFAILHYCEKIQYGAVFLHDRSPLAQQRLFFLGKHFPRGNT